MGLSEFFGVLARRWMIIVLAGVLAAGAAFVVGGARTPSYSAQAQVLVREGLSDGVARLVPTMLRNVDRDWNTRVEGLRSESLAQDVIDRKGYELEPAALAGRVQVTPDPLNGFVTVAVSDADPEVAAELTNEIVTTYAKRARDLQETQLADAIESAEAQLAQARDRITPLGSATSQNPEFLGVQAYDEAAAVVDTLRMGVATQVDPVEVVREAVAPAPVAGGTQTLKTVLFGLFAGLALGLVLALMLEYLARTGAAAGAREA